MFFINQVMGHPSHPWPEILTYSNLSSQIVVYVVSSLTYLSVLACFLLLCLKWSQTLGTHLFGFVFLGFTVWLLLSDLFHSYNCENGLHVLHFQKQQHETRLANQSTCFREADFFLDKTGIVRLMGKDLQGYVLFSFSILMKVCVYAIISYDIKKRKRDPESRTERMVAMT